MPRFLLVRGKPHVLFEGSDTPALGPGVDARGKLTTGPSRRYVGKALRADHSDAEHHVERYEDVEQIVLDDMHVRNGIRDGELELIAECVAKHHGHAPTVFAEAKTKAAEQAAQRARGDAKAKE